MRFTLFFLILFLSVLSLSLTQGSYEDCCLKYAKEVRESLKKRVMSYRKQQQDGGCNLPAIVFKLRRTQLCARPDDKWVQDLMNQIDKKPQLNKQIGARRRNKHTKHWH